MMKKYSFVVDRYVVIMYSTVQSSRALQKVHEEIKTKLCGYKMSRL
jgi:hypothetical protein